MPDLKKRTATWTGDENILPLGVRVDVLATDPACPDGRGAAWVRWWGFDHPMYRSCDLADLEGVEESDWPDDETVKRALAAAEAELKRQDPFFVPSKSMRAALIAGAPVPEAPSNRTAELEAENERLQRQLDAFRIEFPVTAQAKIADLKAEVRRLREAATPFAEFVPENMAFRCPTMRRSRRARPWRAANSPPVTAVGCARRFAHDDLRRHPHRLWRPLHMVGQHP